MPKLIYKFIYYLYFIYFHVVWSDWNPWAVAVTNLAWDRYTKTDIYKERKLLMDIELLDDYEDFAEQAFSENAEALFYIKQFTWKDKLKILFIPFSCGDKYGMPFYVISDWWNGTERD